jgi:hypothetical protein
MKTVRFFSVALALVLVAGVASAQAPWCLDGPNAALTLQGQSPDVADPVNHDVTVTLPGILLLEVTSGVNANAGLALLASTLDAAAQSGIAQGILPYDAADSFDIGSSLPAPAFLTDVQILGDGLNPAPGSINDALYGTNDGNAAFGTPPTFTFAFNVGTLLNGVQYAFQAIVREPGNPPFFFDNTQAVSANLIVGLTAVANVGDDGAVEVPFTPGFTFDFHGVQYPSIWVNGNGYANFGGLTTLAGGGFLSDFVALAGAEPFIALHQADWTPNVVGYQQVGTSATAIWGDPANGGNMAHFGSSDNGNVYSLNFELNDGMGGNPNAGNFQIVHDVLIDDPTLTATHYGTGARGHGPGGAATIVATAEDDLNLPQASAPGEAQLEEHILGDNGGAAAIVNGWDGAGSQRGYNNADKSWNGRTLDFLVNTPIAVAGDQGYVSFPNLAGPMPQTPDVGTLVDVATGAPVPNNQIDAVGGEMVTFSGSFELLLDALGVDPGGIPTVEFDPAGAQGGPFAGTLLGIADTSGTLTGAGVNPGFVIGGISGAGTAHRDMQACQVFTPVFPMGLSGNMDVLFRFSDGSTVTTTVFLGTAGTVIQSFMLGDDISQAVALTNTIPFYGVNYNTVNVGSNGQVTFGTGAGGFSNNVTDAFNGFDTGATEPGVSPIWVDLNVGGTGSGATYVVTEDTTSGATTVAFNNQVDWGSGVLVGNWDVTFDGMGNTTFNYGGVIPGLFSTAVTIAYTDGDGLAGTIGSDTDLTDGVGTGFVNAIAGSYTTGVTAGTMAPDSVAEDFPGTGDLAATFPAGINILDVGGMGAPGTLVIF